MEAGRVTPRALEADRERAWLQRQHEHDLEALELAADVIAHLAATVDDQVIVIANLRREQTVLLLHARRDRLA